MILRVAPVFPYFFFYLSVRAQPFIDPAFFFKIGAFNACTVAKTWNFNRVGHVCRIRLGVRRTLKAYAMKGDSVMQKIMLQSQNLKFSLPVDVYFEQKWKNYKDILLQRWRSPNRPWSYETRMYFCGNFHVRAYFNMGSSAHAPVFSNNWKKGKHSKIFPIHKINPRNTAHLSMHAIDLFLSAWENTTRLHLWHVLVAKYVEGNREPSWHQPVMYLK